MKKVMILAAAVAIAGTAASAGGCKTGHSNAAKDATSKQKSKGYALISLDLGSVKS